MSTRASQPPLRVAVVGGSLGGLTAALLLRDVGCEVDVYERSESKLSGFGAGIVVHEATMRYFNERGRSNARGLEVAATYFRYVDAAGRLVHEEQSPYTFTAWSTLYRNLLDLFGGRRYHRGHTLMGFDQDPDGVTARFAGKRLSRLATATIACPLKPMMCEPARLIVTSSASAPLIRSASSTARLIASMAASGLTITPLRKPRASASPMPRI